RAPGLEDLAARPAPGREAAARARAAAEAERPFDLAAGPLLRAALLRLGPEEHVLLLTLHHIVADGWSLGVLVREVAALYPAALAGDPAGAGLPPLAVQYPDYAVWQRGWLSGEVLARQLGYWRARLAGAPGGGAAARLLRHDAGGAGRPRGGAELPGAAGPGQGELPGGLRPPGPAVRAAGRGAAPRARPQPQPPRPGRVRLRGRSRPD